MKKVTKKKAVVRKKKTTKAKLKIPADGKIFKVKGQEGTLYKSNKEPANGETVLTVKAYKDGVETSCNGISSRQLKTVVVALLEILNEGANV